MIRGLVILWREQFDKKLEIGNKDIKNKRDA